MGKTDMVVDDFFKNIVDDSQMAILYLAPESSNTTKIDDYKVTYANQKAERLFFDTSTTSQNTTVSQLPKLYEFNDIVGHASQIIATQNSHEYNVLKKVEHDNLSVKVKIAPYSEGLLITVTEIIPEFIGENKSKNPLDELDIRKHEL
jgi:nitrogen-specific signal transduction histidine kinase